MAIRYTHKQIGNDLYGAAEYVAMGGDIRDYQWATAQNPGPMIAAAEAAGVPLEDWLLEQADVYDVKPDKKKDSNLIGKGLQGLARIGKYIPGPIGAGIAVADQIAGGKLSGHDISKNPLVKVAAGAAGGAAGSAMGVPGASGSMLQGAQAGARTAIQRELGLQPDARTLATYFSPASKAARAAAKSTGAAGSTVGDWLKTQVPTGGTADSSGMGLSDKYDPTGNTIGGINNKPQRTVGGTGEQSRYDDDTSLIGELPGSQSDYSFNIPGDPNDNAGIFGAGNGQDPTKLAKQKDWSKSIATPLNPNLGRQQAIGGGAGGFGGLGSAAAIALLTKLLDRGDTKVQPPAAPAPAPTGGGYSLPTYPGVLGLATNAYAQDDQRRRLAAAKGVT